MTLEFLVVLLIKDPVEPSVFSFELRPARPAEISLHGTTDETGFSCTLHGEVKAQTGSNSC